MIVFDLFGRRAKKQLQEEKLAEEKRLEEEKRIAEEKRLHYSQGSGHKL